MHPVIGKRGKMNKQHLPVLIRRREVHRIGYLTKQTSFCIAFVKNINNLIILKFTQIRKLLSKF